MGDFQEFLEQQLDAINALPTLSEVVLEIQRALKDEDSDAQTIAQIVTQDPSLTANLLQLANSVYYGARSDAISSIQLAIARLGLRETGRILMTLAIIKTFDHIGETLDYKRFWKHSLIAAITTRIIKKFCARKNAFSDDDAYVAGLLHDIGSLILDQFFPEQFQNIHAYALEHSLSIAEAEWALLGMDHGIFGAKLLGRWRLPENIVAAVAHHHYPGNAKPAFRALAQAVHLADSICTLLDIGDGGDGHIKGFSEGAWHDLGLTANDIPDIIQQIAAEADRCDAFLSFC